MNKEFPGAVPEVPVNNLRQAAAYYENCLGFHKDWGQEGIGQVSRGNCRIFLTDQAFREQNRKCWRVGGDLAQPQQQSRSR